MGKHTSAGTGYGIVLAACLSACLLAAERSKLVTLSTMPL
jgi:hypothetical protein